MEMGLVARIRQAMQSEKFKGGFVNSSMMLDFDDLLISQPDVNLETAYIPLLVETKQAGKVLPGELDSIGAIHAVVAPYSRLPEISRRPRSFVH